MKDTEKTRWQGQCGAHVRHSAKRLLILLLVIAMAAGSGGCLFKRVGHERILLEHLKEKYNGQEFITLDMGGMGYFGSGDGTWMYCYPKGGDPETDEVSAELDIDEDGKFIFSDNYFGILIREEVEAEVLNILSDLELPMKAYYREIGYFDEIYDATKTYADLKQAIIAGEDVHWFDISIFLLCEDIENRELYARQIFDKLEDVNHRGLISLCVIADAELYGKFTRKNQNTMFDPDDTTMFLFTENLN